MIQSPHISRAVQSYDSKGENFHEVMIWHLVHGLVISCMEFLCIGYFCRKDELNKPLPKGEADTVFVSYMTGDMPTLRTMAPDIQNIAFKRGFKNDNPAKIYPMERFKTLIN